MTSSAPVIQMETNDLNNIIQMDAEMSYQNSCEQRLAEILNSVEGLDASKVTYCLQSFIRHRSDTTLLEPPQEKVTKQEATLIKSIMEATEEFSAIEASTQKLAGRKALQVASTQLLSEQTTTDSGDSSALVATILVYIAMSFNHHAGGSEGPPSSRAGRRIIASAMRGVVTKRKLEQNVTDHEEVAMVHAIFNALFQEASSYENQARLNNSTSTDWHIISGLAKSLKVDCLGDEVMATMVAKIVSDMVRLDIFKADDSSVEHTELVPKVDVAASLALAAQLQPWQVLEPVELINLAISFDLDHSAEQICEAVTSSSPDTAAARASVGVLLKGAFDCKQYRQADNYATKFFLFGGKQRFLEARYLHACGTIVKVIRKGALPVIDKQIERVDKAVKTMEKDGPLDSDDTVSSTINCKTAGQDIRNFALEHLEETENADAALRLATLWGMEYAYDEETVAKAAETRRKKYLQWDELVSGSPPDLISTPEALLEAMNHLESSQSGNVYGFDAEWSENDAGVDVLQLASSTSVVLLDIPVLSNSVEGFAALEKTVGRMFAFCTMVGFSCRQDISKLRGSPTCYRNEKYKKHWMQGSDGVVDLQTMASKSDQSLTKLGLSRVCERFLKKPLDKSEQCSAWNARPLSLRQRIYASLDAWTVRAVYKILLADPE